MPNLPKHQCRYPGCFILTTERYCEKHKHEMRRYDKLRGSAHERGYSSRWRKVSKMFLREHPLCECEDCKKHHRLTTANVVHHILPHHGNYELFWDEDNWQAMSKKCHDKYHTLERRASGEQTHNKR